MDVMRTEIVKIEKENPDMAVIQRAGDILKKGGLVAFPTETVYGLGADALNEKAAAKIYEAKGRPSDNPLIVHIGKFGALPEIVRHLSSAAKMVAQTFWPGPLTMIFEKSRRVPLGTTGGLSTVAVRYPANEIARKLILAGGGFVCAPSANTSGRPSPTNGQDVAEDMDGKIEMILDGGSVDIGVESTILDMTVDPPMILRPGAITRGMLLTVLPEIAVDETVLSASSMKRPKAPGMKYRHYAPRAPMILVEGDREQTVEAVRHLVEKASEDGMKVGVIAAEETAASYTRGIVKCIGSRQEEQTIAHNLYRILREFDRERVGVIYSEVFETEGIGTAIMNRMIKAAGNQVIKAEDAIRL